MSATAILELESTLTDRFQTTIPAGVRAVLGLGKRDRIRFVVDGSSEVKIVKVDAGYEEASDGALAPFLALIAKDFQDRPEVLEAYAQEDADYDMQALRESRGGR